MPVAARHKLRQQLRNALGDQCHAFRTVRVCNLRDQLGRADRLKTREVGLGDDPHQFAGMADGDMPDAPLHHHVQNVRSDGGWRQGDGIGGHHLGDLCVKRQGIADNLARQVADRGDPLQDIAFSHANRRHARIAHQARSGLDISGGRAGERLGCHQRLDRGGGQIGFVRFFGPAAVKKPAEGRVVAHRLMEPMCGQHKEGCLGHCPCRGHAGPVAQKPAFAKGISRTQQRDWNIMFVADFHVAAIDDEQSLQGCVQRIDLLTRLKGLDGEGLDQGLKGCWLHRVIGMDRGQELGHRKGIACHEKTCRPM